MLRPPWIIYYCEGKTFVDRSKISRHTRFSFQFLIYKSNDELTVKLHQNVPAAGNRVDFETATRKTFVITIIGIHYLEYSTLLDCRLFIFWIVEGS